MKAILINKDQSLSFADVDNPTLKQGEVLIEVYASAVNRADLLQREGNYPPPPGCPEWPGLAQSTIIPTSLGPTSHFPNSTNRFCSSANSARSLGTFCSIRQQIYKGLTIGFEQ